MNCSKVCGIYWRDNKTYGFWKSQEYFVKEGEVRWIDGKLHYLDFSVWPNRYWYPIDTKNKEKSND